MLRWADQAAVELAASNWATGCPVATVVLETAHTSDVLAAAGAAALDGWRDAPAAGVARHGATDAEARALATVVVAGIEGGALLARAARDAAPLLVVAGELAALLRDRLGPPRSYREVTAGKSPRIGSSP